MTYTPRFDTDSGGWWAGDYGERICQWTYDSTARRLQVNCPGRIEGKSVVLPFDNEVDKNRLARIAIELAEQITGFKYDV